jgi:hypothetical protein
MNNGKNRLIYETQEDIFWLKFSLKLLKLLFSAGKITKNKLLPTQPEENDVKNYQIIEEKKSTLYITVIASLKKSNRLKKFFFNL